MHRYGIFSVGFSYKHSKNIRLKNVEPKIKEKPHTTP